MKIFFDLDGTLIDVSKRHHTVYSEMVTAMGGNPLDKEEYWRLKRAKTVWPEVLQKSNLPAEDAPTFLDAFIPKIEDPAYLELDIPIPGAFEALAKVSAQNECYLVSLRRNSNNLLEEVRRLDLEQYFKKVLTSHSESDGVDKKLELIGGELQDGEGGLAVGDTEADIKTGKELGLRTIGVLSGIRNREFLEKLGPDALIETVEALPELI